MQYYVKVGFNEERKKAFAWLAERGYQIAEYLKEEYEYSTVIIDDNRVFGGNPTCFAAAIGAGKDIYTWQQWVQLH